MIYRLASTSSGAMRQSRWFSDIGRRLCCMGREQRASGQGAEVRLLTKDEARRIAALKRRTEIWGLARDRSVSPTPTCNALPKKSARVRDSCLLSPKDLQSGYCSRRCFAGLPRVGYQVAVSAGYITLLAGSASTSPAPLPPRLGGLFVRAEENVIC